LGGVPESSSLEENLLAVGEGSVFLKKQQQQQKKNKQKTCAPVDDLMSLGYGQS